MGKCTKTWSDLRPEQKAAHNTRKRERYAMLTPEEKKVHNRKRTRRRFATRNGHGVTWAQAQEMIAAQGGRCAICNGMPEKTLRVDHCHKTATIRGMLCNSCNLLLGHAKDSIEVLRSAVDYLKNQHLT